MIHSITCVRTEKDRKHRAPKSALRHSGAWQNGVGIWCQKAPSTKRCIKATSHFQSGKLALPSQKAPSAKRCIKTQKNWLSEYWLFGQKAPSATRCIKTYRRVSGRPPAPNVRKHRAPKSALRPSLMNWRASKFFSSESTERQKAH